ncbi:hypothetical protein ACFSB1_12385 [Halopseudomonas phragmitis]|uniref:hypothetical protein n=1 Tax=Halopseudomonas phragmitis TaxID=1931241 RepID=UPI0012BAC910|nr:hypothetical protein [Halopseudomonas phragmitis]
MTPIYISIFSSAIAIVSLFFAVYSWRQVNRPLVTARITAVSGGEGGIVLNLLVENTGNRPARDIRLIAEEAHVKAASIQQAIPVDAQRCFFSNIYIPVLANGRSASNAFWHLGQSDSWSAGAEIPVTIKYFDLTGRSFSNKLRLLLADDAGFAQTSWGKGYSSNG